MQGEGEGAEEAAAEDGNQTLRQPDRVDLRGGRGDLTCAFAEAFMHVNKLYQSPLLSLEFINKDFYTPALNAATFPRQTQKKEEKEFFISFNPRKNFIRHNFVVETKSKLITQFYGLNFVCLAAAARKCRKASRPRSGPRTSHHKSKSFSRSKCG